MANVTFLFTVRDSAATPPGARKTGLTPTWVFLKKMTDGSNISPQPSFTEIAQGQYKFTYDAEFYGDASAQIDVGAGLTNPSDRYIDMWLHREHGRILNSLPPEEAGFEGGLPLANNFGQVTAVVDDYTLGNDPESRILATPSNKISTDASGRTRIDLAQTIPNSNTAQTVGDALNAARAQGFGKWILSGTSLTLYAADGTTVVRVFTLDSASAPTQRV